MRKKTPVLVALLLATMSSMAQLPYQNPSLSPHERAVDLCQRLSLEEKAQIMMNESPAIARHGIPQYEWWSEALHGVGRNGFATVFPITMGMAASWDDALLYKVYTAVSDEACAKNNLARQAGTINRYQGTSFWTPNINIFRDPRWGRGQETYGEDPYLTERMGLAVVAGLQGLDPNNGFKRLDPQYYKLLACAKHFAIHSGPEWNRHSFNVENLSGRDLYETYLPAFKALVQQGDVREVMCAYQRWDGDPCCGSNRLLQQILRDEWGFKGLVVSDCGAISDFWQPGHHEVSRDAASASAKAVLSGTDVECGSEYRSLPEAVSHGAIREADINVSVVRLLEERFAVGDFDDEQRVPWKRIGEDVIASKAHKELAYQMARETMTLLQNKGGILPLAKQGQRIMVMGPNANDSIMLWGNYSGYPTETTSILKGIREKIGQVDYLQACSHTRNEVLESRYDEIVGTNGKAGLVATFWNNTDFKGTPATTVNYSGQMKLSNGGNTVFAPGVNLEGFSARIEGVYTPKRTEDVEFTLSFDDCVRLIIDGDTVVDSWRPRARVLRGNYKKHVEAGKPHRIQIDYLQNTDMAVMDFDIVHRAENNLQQLVSAARKADVVVFVGGISPYLEGEEMKVDEPGFKGGDRTSIELPEAQRRVLTALHEAGVKVVLVNCSGGAMALAPETQSCEAILQAWYGGEAGGKAVADVLFGDYNPSGKLPVTFYASDADLPDFLDYSMKNRTYRYFQGQPLFAFGYGQSYTSFAYGQPKYSNGQLTVQVTNTGRRDGDEVVQVYVRNPRDTEGPQKSLRAFKRVHLKAGETQQVSIDMDAKRFEGWDASTNTIRFQPGKYQVLVGSSSRDADLKAIWAEVK